MGKNNSRSKKGKQGGGAGRRDFIRANGNNSRKRDEFVFRSTADIIASEQEAEEGAEGRRGRTRRTATMGRRRLS